MRRASRTGIGAAAAKRWTVPGRVGSTGGAAVLGSGGLYVAGPLPTGEDAAPGTGGVRGLDVAVDRGLATGGKEVRRETMKTRGAPRDSVTRGA
ncbi:hypothetical protein ACWFQ8_05520 [Streptomyces sp. NPDC055254]